MGEEKIEDDPALLFDGMKKKKKKKKTDEAIEDAGVPDADHAATPDADAPQDDDPAAMFADMKKKKKKKKPVLEDDETATPPGEEAQQNEGDEDVAAMFDGMKKKKKKRPDLADFEAKMKADEEDVEDELNDDVLETDGGKSNEETSLVDGEPWLTSNRDYTYQELLSRVFKILRQNNPELAGEKKRYTIVPPSVHREGAKKTVFANISEICKRMRRQPEHCIQYLFAELGTSGSIDGNQRLMIKGRFSQKQIENVLKKYIGKSKKGEIDVLVEYVTCKTCKSADTILKKENRLFFLECESCGSTRTVSAIKTGFMAQTQRRAAQRAAAP